MSKVVLKIADIDHTILIFYLSISTLFIVLVLTCILDFCFSLLEIPFSMSQSIQEASFIVVSVCPIVLSFTIWPVFLIISYICFTIKESLSPHSMFKRVFKFTFISWTIFHNKDSKTLNLVILPLTHIALSLNVGPHSTSSFMSILPLTIIYLSICPLKYSSTMLYSLFKLPSINRTIW